MLKVLEMEMEHTVNSSRLKRAGSVQLSATCGAGLSSHAQVDSPELLYRQCTHGNLWQIRASTNVTNVSGCLDWS